MPNRRASRLIKLILQNKGKLAKGKRTAFAEISDEEIDRLNALYGEHGKMSTKLSRAVPLLAVKSRPRTQGSWLKMGVTCSESNRQVVAPPRVGGSS